MRFLVTGGAGFIGSNLSEELHKLGKVHVIDDLSTGNIRKIGYQVSDIVAEHFDSIKLEKLPPSPKITPKELADMLSSSLPLDGEDSFDILDECQEKIIPNCNRR